MGGLLGVLGLGLLKAKIRRLVMQANAMGV